MSDPRRCDGCAFWRPVKGLHGRSDFGVCHHSANGALAADDGGECLADWWCEHFWPASAPLPEPWRTSEPCDWPDAREALADLIAAGRRIESHESGEESAACSCAPHDCPRIAGFEDRHTEATLDRIFGVQ